jgi:hypothetical protein
MDGTKVFMSYTMHFSHHSFLLNTLPATMSRLIGGLIKQFLILFYFEKQT